MAAVSRATSASIGRANATVRAAMRPPAILTLQLLNACIGAGQYLAFATATGMWTADGWTPWQVGLAMTAANLAYAAVVAQGGRLSDAWGRARTAILGASICACGAALALIADAAWSALAAAILGCAGSAFFFPGNVGLFSDARTADGASSLPLHVKVSRYNLGWSGGNIVGFGLAWALSSLPSRVGWSLYLLAALVAAVVLWRWRSLPPQPPRADGDRSPHPALNRLIWMGRGALLVYCLLGMAFISLLTRALKSEGMDATAAQAASTAALFCYAIGYFATFLVLGLWSGWVLRPWRLLALQVPVALAALAVLWLGLGATVQPLALSAAALLLGVGFAATYTGSIYYSMRLPEGAARAAALHETALGIGSTAGPLLCGAFMSLAADGALAALGIWMVLVSAVVLAMQALAIPGAARLGAR
jgi:predicted MFS family arabinose efflux permease